MREDGSHLMEANPVEDREILPLLPVHLSKVLQVLLVAQQEDLSWRRRQDDWRMLGEYLGSGRGARVRRRSEAAAREEWSVME